MNLLGKICIVGILVASLVFMALSMAVYTTHTNWYAEVNDPGGLDEQLRNAQTEFQQLSDQYNRLERELNSEVQQRTQQLAKLETERANFAQINREIQSELDSLRQDLRTSTAMADATQKQNVRYDQQIDTLEQEIKDEQQKRDAAFLQAKQATEELQQRLADLSRATERGRQLVSQVADYRSWLSSLGFNPSQPPANVAPRVAGRVQQVSIRGGETLVLISIGSHDGIQRDHTVELYRGDRYLGRAEITRTERDQAVGRVIRKLGNIQEGDDVSTKLRVG